MQMIINYAGGKYTIKMPHVKKNVVLQKELAR